MIPDNFYKIPPNERRKWLAANADYTRADVTVFKDLNPAQIDDIESDIASMSVELSEIEAEKKQVLSSFKERIDPVKEELKELIQKFRTKQEEITTDVFYIADYDHGRMIGYAPDGVEVENRRLRDDERQSTIHSIGRATNN